MLKNRLLKFLPILLALLLVFTVSVFAAMAEPEDESIEEPSESTTDETSAEETSEVTSDEASDEASDTASEENSKAASDAASSEASAETSAETSEGSSGKSASNIPWKLIITVAVILVIAAVLFILAKTNSKLGQKIAKFFKDYKSEIGKISWMPRNDLLRSTLVVLAVLIVASVAIGLLDYGFSALVRLLSSIG